MKRKLRLQPQTIRNLATDLMTTVVGGLDQTSFPCNTVLRCVDTQAATNCGPLCPPSGLGCNTVSCPVGPL